MQSYIKKRLNTPEKATAYLLDLIKEGQTNLVAQIFEESPPKLSADQWGKVFAKLSSLLIIDKLQVYNQALRVKRDEARKVCGELHAYGYSYSAASSLAVGYAELVDKTDYDIKELRKIIEQTEEENG